MDVQRALASDIAMAFDDCTAYPGDRAAGARFDAALDALGAAQLRPLLPRAARGGDPPPGHLFGIVQGGMYEDLRLESIEALSQRDFAGYAIGGLAVGETEEERLRVLDMREPAAAGAAAALPDGRGLSARHRRRGGARRRHVRLRHADAACAQRPPVHRPPASSTSAMPCTSAIPGRSTRRAAARPASRYSRAYLRHLDRCNEILGVRLATLHNLHFYLELMRQIRAAIAAGQFRAAGRPDTGDLPRRPGVPVA